jgi:integrase
MKTTKNKKKSTKYPGVRYRESSIRPKINGRPDRYFTIRYRIHGELKEEQVGWESEGISPQYAAKERGELIANRLSENAPQSLREKKQKFLAAKRGDIKRSIKLEQAFEEFLRVRELKERTIYDYKRSMRVALVELTKFKVVEISRDMVAHYHERLTKEQGKAQANQHMRFLRSLLNFCAGNYDDADGTPLIKFNPVDRLTQTKAWNKVNRRQTIIKGHEIPAWFEAVMDLDNETVKTYLIFLLLTGMRREEAMKLKVEQFDLKDKSFTVTDTKNGKPLTLPIPKYLLSVVKNQIKRIQDSKYLFPGRKKDGHMVEPKGPIAKVVQASGVKFSPGYLRRLFMTTADSFDFSGFALQRLVNHSIGSNVTSGYIVTDVERLRGPIQKIENKLLAAAGVSKSSKVINLRG